MYECGKCEAFGLRFRRPYKPEEFLEGSLDSPVWIIGLNPAREPSWDDRDRDVDSLRSLDPKSHAYFNAFKTVSEVIYSSLGRAGGTAHTDLVKCSSRGWPPGGAKPAERRQIIVNCREYLLDQIRRHRPKMLVCNGADVCTAMRTLLPPSEPLQRSETSYYSMIGEHRLCVVMSGFVGRIDNYAKSRLGREIETRLEEMKTKL